MHKQIYVNLPVKDLSRSRAFFETLGYGIDARFTNDDAACVILGENIYAMLLRESFFKTFTPRDIADTKKSVEVLLATDFDSRAEVDEMMDKVIKAGGTEARETQDYGFMYSRAYNDLDGHTWEIGHMDLAAYEKMIEVQK